MEEDEWHWILHDSPEAFRAGLAMAVLGILMMIVWIIGGIVFLLHVLPSDMVKYFDATGILGCMMFIFGIPLITYKEGPRRPPSK